MKMLWLICLLCLVNPKGVEAFANPGEEAETAASPSPVDSLFPQAAAKEEETDPPRDGEMKEICQAVKTMLQNVEKRLQDIEARLGSERRPTTAANTIERRLADIERRMDLMEQRLRRLEMQ